MNYQNIACFGDSQTFGARSYGCYPLYLAKYLTRETPYVCRTINRSVNGYMVRDLWFKINKEIDSIIDTFICCLLIGANDVGNGSDLELFEEYYNQILWTLMIKRYRVVLCGEIPPIFPDGHCFFDKECKERRMELNNVLRGVVKQFQKTHLVTFGDLFREDYEDSVHFNENGNMKIARAFADALIKL